MLELLKNDKVQRIVLVSVVVILIIFLFRQCGEINKIKARADQNDSAKSPSTKTIDKDGNLNVDKYPYLVEDIKDLKNLNSELYKELISIKKKIISVSSTTITYSNTLTYLPIIVTQKGNSGTIDINYEKIDNGFERKIKGELGFSINEGKLKTDQNLKLTQDYMRFKMISGFEKNSDGSYKAFSKTPNGMELDVNIEGAMVDKYLSGYKPGNDFQLGLTAGYGYSPYTNSGVPFIGIGVSYPLVNLTKLFKP